jgi:hypothetical protein
MAFKIIVAICRPSFPEFTNIWILDLDKMKYLRNANADTEVECAEIGLPSS